MSFHCPKKPLTRGTAAPKGGGSPLSLAPPSNIAISRSRLGLLHQTHAPQLPVERTDEHGGVTHKSDFERRHACSPRHPATKSETCCTIPSGWTKPTSLTLTTPRAAGNSRTCSPTPSEAVCLHEIDVHKNQVVIACSHGKPSSARIRRAMGGRIAPGPLLINDPEARITRRSGTSGSRTRHAGPLRTVQSGADGDDERSVLLAQALPMVLHGNVATEPEGISQLVRLLLPDHPDPVRLRSD